MLPTTRLSQGLILGALMLLIITTRGHHFASLYHLPSASWAVFFLGGLYLRRALSFATLLLTAFVMDLIAVTWGGVSNFCLSPAYPMLIAAYGSLWLSGLWAAREFTHPARAVAMTLLAAVGGAFLCGLMSSGAFYFLSGRFESTTLAGFGHKLVTQFPTSLMTLLGYLAAAATVHVLFAGLSRWFAHSAHRA